MGKTQKSKQKTSRHSGGRISDAAKEVLRDRTSSGPAKIAAELVLSSKPAKGGREVGAAAKVLRDPKASRSAKLAAASALTQRPVAKPRRVDTATIMTIVREPGSRKESGRR